jgi:alpha-L-rhamnosidase
MVKVTTVRFEHFEEHAIGIGSHRPHISWSFEGKEDENWHQTSYELEIRRQGDRVEHHVVTSSESVLVPWTGSPLQSSESASVRVRVMDSDGGTTEWSVVAVVEAGLLRKEHWTCSVIEPAGPYTPGPLHKPVIFRRQIEYKKPIFSARLYITAHGVYEAYINDKRVGDHVLAPGWTSYSHRLVYQTFDVASYLKAGKNKIDVYTGEGWFCSRLGFREGKTNIYGESIGLVAMLVVQHRTLLRKLFTAQMSTGSGLMALFKLLKYTMAKFMMHENECLNRRNGMR